MRKGLENGLGRTFSGLLGMKRATKTAPRGLGDAVLRALTLEPHPERLIYAPRRKLVRGLSPSWRRSCNVRN